MIVFCVVLTACDRNNFPKYWDKVDIINIACLLPHHRYLVL